MTTGKEMNKYFMYVLLLAATGVNQCGITREMGRTVEAAPEGLSGLEQACRVQDTIRNMMIQKAAATILYEDETYEVTATLFVEKDSIIYLSAVYSGFEIMRASVEHDSIKVIDRMNRIIYRTPLQKKFGYQQPMNFRDLQNIVSKYFICREMSHSRNGSGENISFEFDEEYIKKRIIFDREDLTLRTFEFYHSRTDEYLMGERTVEGLKIYSNFIVGNIEIIAKEGTTVYNHDVDVSMEVNPNRYTFIELQ